MMTEDALRRANSLVALHHRMRKNGTRAQQLFDIELELLTIGVRVDNPIGAPDPRAPPGGSAQALRTAHG